MSLICLRTLFIDGTNRQVATTNKPNNGMIRSGERPCQIITQMTTIKPLIANISVHIGANCFNTFDLITELRSFKLWLSNCEEKFEPRFKT